jgi:hypothetical protein
LCLLLVAGLYAADASKLTTDSPKFRTDADGPVTNKPVNPREKSTVPDWYQLVEGKFPPAGSAHAVSGELMLADHLERRFQIRVDRNDSQDRGVWDLPLDAAMLPYGAIYYRGAPAALQDIPVGTHLHGLFYLKDPQDKTPLLGGTQVNRRSPESDFRRCFRLEDDFSYQARQKRVWRIESVDLTTSKLTATLEQDGKPVDKPQIFDLPASARVMQGAGFTDIKALQVGQKVLFNLTWVTLYGPGRITDIWIDDSSRKLVAAQQLQRHHDHVRERGLPGFVDAVDDDAQIVTITFFDGVDPKLFDDITIVDGKPVGWPLTKEADNPTAPKGTIAVARPTLMTYDPVNDRKGGNIVNVKKIPAEPGSSGVQIQVKVDMMLEGFRPRRVVRFYPATWKVIALPREEQFFGRE